MAISARFGSVSAQAGAFILQVKSDNTGTSATNQFTIPKFTGETYDYTATFDGTSSSSTSDTAHTITFPSGIGTYDVYITGTFPRIYFNNGGDRRKLIGLKQFGNVGWATSWANSFYGCASLVGSIPELPSGVTDFSQAFTECYFVAGAIPNIPTSATVIDGMFQSCQSVTGSIPALPSGITSANFAFSGCSLISGSIPSLPTGLIDGVYMFGNSTGLSGAIPTLPSTLGNAANMFYNLSSLSGALPATLPSGLTNTSYMFSGCGSITGSVPALPAGVTTAREMYNQCTSLNGTIGSQAAADGTLDNVQSMFDGCASLTGNSEAFWSWTTPPTTTTFCYRDCSSLTDFATIPAGYL